MWSLQRFAINHNRLKGTTPSTVGFTLPNFISFLNSANEFSGMIPESFSNASQLERLVLCENNFVGQVPTALGNLQNLSQIGLSFNNLGNYSANSWDFIPSLTNCSALKSLSLAENNLGGVLPESIANLSTNLMRLYLGDNEIFGNIPATLENLVNLVTIGLNDNLFTGTIPSSLGKLQNLQFLALRGNGLSGRIPSSIGNLTRLFKLYLSDNKLEGGIPRDIAKCQNLQFVHIANNKLSGTISSEIFGLSSLIRLYFSRNKLSGSLPVEVGKLTNAIEIDATNGDNNDGDIEIDEELGNINPMNANAISAHLRDCLVSILEIRLACSQESPNERMNMGEVIRELQGIKNAFESVGIRGQRRRIS